MKDVVEVILAILILVAMGSISFIVFPWALTVIVSLFGVSLKFVEALAIVLMLYFLKSFLTVKKGD